MGQNVNQVREKITEFSELKQFVSSLASQNRDFWLQMPITQRRNIKDVQTLGFAKKCSMLPPNVRGLIKNGKSA